MFAEALEDMVRAIARDEMAKAFADASRGLQLAPQPAPPERAASGGPDPLDGFGSDSLVPYAVHVLREADGGPLDCHTMAERIYSLGFRHRRPPKYADQLVRSLNSLASPSQHPELFERVGPRVLRLKEPK
jgi:hypothetical protein